MKLFSSLVVLMTTILLFSCKPKEEQVTATPQLPSSDFVLVAVLHKVADFDSFRTYYMAHDSARMSVGLTHRTLGRGKDDANMVLVANQVADTEKAKAFFASPELRARMDSAGVMNPDIHFIHVTRWDTAAAQGKERAFVHFRVKDYNTFITNFDAEGRDFRMSHGFVDRGIGQAVDDPNHVYLNFYVMDAAKMIAFMQSPEFADIRTKAGLEGEPIAFFYTAE